MSLFQDPLFPPSMSATISLNDQHDLVKLAHIIDWDTLTLLIIDLREKKGKAKTGVQPRYRALLGAVVLMSIKNITFREAEDLISNYVPARYLCGLMEADWTVDHVTIHDFTKMIGWEGMEAINKSILGVADSFNLINTKELMSDTTAQEAMIPYPSEAGLMKRFMDLTKAQIKKLGGKFTPLKKIVKEKVETVKTLVRKYHLFSKTKEAKNEIAKELYQVTKDLHSRILSTLEFGRSLSSKAGKDLTQLNQTMETLFPQILHFLETGFVANKKIIHLQMEKLYSIVRGKAGKKVEFGLKWGINRISGGFLQGFLAPKNTHASDKKFCIEAVKKHKETFGFIPEIYGFDRGGYSKSNIKKLKTLGVKDVGVAPMGQADWEVTEKKQDYIKRERAQVEGCIGSIKRSKYGFNKPDAKSIEAMVTYGHRAILGFNMNKLIKSLELV